MLAATSSDHSSEDRCCANRKVARTRITSVLVSLLMGIDETEIGSVHHPFLKLSGSEISKNLAQPLIEEGEPR